MDNNVWVTKIEYFLLYVIIVLGEAFTLCTDISCPTLIYLSSVAIRGKLARDKAKRIKEKRPKSDNKLTNKC